MTYLNQRRATEAEFEVGGRRYAVYAHDWRAEPALAWLDRMAEWELATDQRVDVLEAEMPAPLLVLSEPEFQAAVRQALRDYTRPAALAASPLLRSRLATQELAAERLGLPFSTYRYHLAGGLRRVTERLWRRELHGDED
jgi:hypothetical protein